MITQQNISNQIDQLRKFDFVGEFKKLDLRNMDLANLGETFDKIDLDALDVFEVRKAIEKLDLPDVDFPKIDLPVKDLSEAKAQLVEVRSAFEAIVKGLVDVATGFAPATRRDIEQLEARIASAEKATKAPAKKAAAKKAPAKRAAAKKAPAKRAAAKKAS